MASTPTIRILAVAAAGFLALSACGESGSSGGGGGGEESAASGDACVGIAGEELVVLEDDMNLQTVDNVIPAVSAAASTPELLAALDAVSAALATEDLIALNAAVDIDRGDPAEVAGEFLADVDVPTGGSGTIVVGGANFTESTVLANVYAQALTAAGFQASVASVGNRELYLPALQTGQEIQVFPEYVGTLTTFLNTQANGEDAEPAASGDLEATLANLTTLGEAAGLVFGQPAEAADQNAFAVTQAFADELGVATLSELADACTDGSLTLGGPTECPERPFCQPGLEETYGLQFSGFSPYDVGGPLTKAAIQAGEVSIGLVFSSDAVFATG